MTKEDVIKTIDGSLYYYSDYVIFLYKQLEDKDNRINKAIEYIKYNLKSFIYSKEYKDLMEILGDKENENN